MRLSNGFVIDKEKTFGELKFTAVRDVFLQNEDGTPSSQLKKRIYDLKCSLHGGIIPVSVPPEVPLREFPYNAVVELVNPVADTVSRKTFGGADVVLEVAGSDDSFHLAWNCARPNAIVTIVALYDKPQLLPLPDMYGKNLVFKTGGVDGCDCNEILMLIEEGKIDTTPLITHRFPLNEIEEAYRIFENKLDGVIKVAISGNK